MVKRTLIIGFVVLFSLALFSGAAFAKGKPYTNSHQNITYDVPDEGDNLHPSGKDRSVEHGGSATQGNAHSDPDDNYKGPDRSNGGADKQPNGIGGIDKEDQDNNNGCGNDDDFEDDNEGWCGSKPKVSDPGNGGKEPEGPTPEIPTVKTTTGKILGVTSLPNTGVKTNSQLTFIVVLLVSGVSLFVVSKRLEALVEVNKA